MANIINLTESRITKEKKSLGLSLGMEEGRHLNCGWYLPRAEVLGCEIKEKRAEHQHSSLCFPKTHCSPAAPPPAATPSLPS